MFTRLDLVLSRFRELGQHRKLDFDSGHFIQANRFKPRIFKRSRLRAMRYHCGKRVFRWELAYAATQSLAMVQGHKSAAGLLQWLVVWKFFKRCAALNS